MKYFSICLAVCASLYSTSAFSQDDVALKDLVDQTDLLYTTSEIKSGTEIGVFKSHAGVWACVNKNKAFWGPLPSNELTRESDVALRSALEKYGVMRPISKNDIFTGQSEKNYSVLAVLKNSNFDICLDSSGVNPKGSSQIEIEINIYSKKDQKIIFTQTYSGSYESAERIEGSPFALISRSFSDAAEKFVADLSTKPQENEAAGNISEVKNGSEKARDICLDLGFQMGTDKFSECYLETIKKM